MTSVSKVEVLCTNGRRINVNVNPNTKLLQILEECCLKQQLGPPEVFELRHIRRTLDLSLTPLQAGLTNMAKLELIKAATQRLETMAKIGLQLEGGVRFQREFDPSTSLSGILQQFEQDDGRGEKLNLTDYRSKNLQPVLNYLSHEIMGDFAFENTTLRKLGITGGSHLLRLRFQTISEEKLILIKVQIDSDQQRLKRLIAKAQAPSDVFKESAIDIMNMENTSSTRPTDIAGISQTNSMLEVSVSPFDVAMNCVEVMATVDPEDNTERDVAMDSDGNRHMDVQADLTGLATEAHSSISDKSAGQARITQSYEFQTAFRQEAGIEQWCHQPEIARASYSSFASSSPFANFKFPEETKGKDVYHNELSVVKRGDFEPCERQMIIFNLNDIHHDTTTYEDVNEEFFEHTVSDLKAWQSARVKELQWLEEQPLMTQSKKRTLLEEKISSRYTRLIIRIQFPDRFVLQGSFRPTETVFSLYKFVKEHLEDPNLSFELFTTPPKVVLVDQVLTLIEASLAPMSVVHFSSAGKTEGFLAAQILKEVSSHVEAQKILEQHFPSTRSLMTSTGTETQMEVEQEQDRERTRVSEAAKSTKSRTGSSEKLPKWFQSGKKQM